MRRLCLVVALSSCINLPPPACVTRCGLQVEDYELCAGVQVEEDRTVKAYEENVVGWTEGVTCAAISGFRMAAAQADDEGCWVDSYYHQRVCGLTFCEYGVVYVGDHNRYGNVFPHELAHVVERCADPDHKTWAARGIFRAIDEVADGGTW